MKIFVKQLFIFLILAFLFVEMVCALLIITNLYLFNYPGKEVYNSITKSKEKSKAKNLLIGDSVARQLFPLNDTSKEINSLACNQAVSMAGHFILLDNYLHSGNVIDTLVLMFSPSSFNNNLDQNFTFHYFIKPFNKKKYSGVFTETVKEQIDKIPFNHFCRIPHVVATSWSPKINYDTGNKYIFLSPVSLEYLEKIKNISIKNQFELIIISPPISIQKKQNVERIREGELICNKLITEFRNYFKNIIYLEDHYFIDGTHLVNPRLHIRQIENIMRN